MNDFFSLLVSFSRPCSAHAGYIGTDRSLLTGHNVLHLRQIARDLLHASSLRHNNTSTAFGEPVVGTGTEQHDTGGLVCYLLKKK